MHDLYKYREFYFLLEAVRRLKNYLTLYKIRKSLKNEQLTELYINFDLYFLLIVTAVDRSIYKFISHRTKYLNKTENLNRFRSKKHRIYLNTLISLLKENPKIWSSEQIFEDAKYALNRILRIQKKYRNPFIHTNAQEDKQYSWLRQKKYPYNPWEAREMFRHSFFILEELYKHNNKYANYLKEIKQILDC